MQRFWKRVRRWGLPPRMRGKGQTFLADDLRVGITPAYAGKRQGFRGAYYSTGDHPRVCGEKHAVPVSAIWSAGSPPRVRGKVTIPGAYSTTDGITPAYAGKSAGAASICVGVGDHPRVCGEKYACARASTSAMGSPPRVRGKAKRHARLLLPAGITPAYAGKSRATAA